MKFISKTIASAVMALAVSFTASTSEAATVSFIDFVNNVGVGAIDLPTGTIDTGLPGFEVDTVGDGTGDTDNIFFGRNNLGIEHSGKLNILFTPDGVRAVDVPLNHRARFAVQVDREGDEFSNSVGFFQDEFFFDNVSPLTLKYLPFASGIENLSYTFGSAGTFSFDELANAGQELWVTLVGSPTTLTVRGNITEAGGYYGVNVSAVPLPPAALAFGTALLGIGLLGRRRKQS